MESELTDWLRAILLSGGFLVVLVLLGVVTFFLLSLPHLRQERARIFVDLLLTEIRKGNSPEQAIVALSRCEDRSLSVRFFLLAAHIENGDRLPDALDKVPRFLPPAVSAMIRSGYETGLLEKVLPACRHRLSEAGDQVRKARNYISLTIMVLIPLWAAALLILATFVYPRFIVILSEMEVPVPWFASLVLEHIQLTFTLAMLPMLIFAVAAFLYAFGPRLRLAALKGFPIASDRFLYGLPWNRNRIRRDFSLMMALLVDEGMPEPEALRIAGRSTGNRYVEQRAEVMEKELSGGRPLLESFQFFDRTGEFQWRWRTAAGTQLPFVPALGGWHAFLEADACKSEQKSSKLFAATLVVLNGVAVGVITFAVFQFMATIIEEAVLW